MQSSFSPLPSWQLAAVVVRFYSIIKVMILHLDRNHCWKERSLAIRVQVCVCEFHGFSCREDSNLLISPHQAVEKLDFSLESMELIAEVL